MDKDLARDFSQHLIQKSEVGDFIEDMGEIIDYFETDVPVTIVERPKISNSSLKIVFVTKTKREFTRDYQLDFKDLSNDNKTPALINELKKFMIGCESVQEAEIQSKIVLHMDKKLGSREEVKNWAQSLNQMIVRMGEFGVKIFYAGNENFTYFNGKEKEFKTEYPGRGDYTNTFDISENLDWLLNNIESKNNKRVDQIARTLIENTQKLWIKKKIVNPKVLAFSSDPIQEVPQNLIDDFTTFSKKWKLTNAGKQELVNILSKARMGL